MGTVREPPHSRDAEQAILGGVIVWPDHAPGVFERVSARDFYVPAHQAIADAVQLLASKQDYDVVLVINVLRSQTQLDKVGGSRYLIQLTDVPTAPSMLTYYADVVRELSRRRTIIRVCNGILEAAYDETKPIDEVMRQYQEFGAEGPGHHRRGVPV